jgi:PAS domain S-box-containing protein
MGLPAEDAGGSQAIRLEQLASIPETIAEGIIVVDSDGYVTYVNANAERILGIRHATMATRSYASRNWKQYTVDGEPIAEEDVPLIRVLRTGRAVEDAEYVIERDDGGRVVVSVNASPLHGEAGTLVGAVASFADITARKRHDQLSVALDEINAAMNATLDFRKILQQVVGDSARAIGTETAAVALREEGDAWIVRAIHGLSQRLVGKRVATGAGMPFVPTGGITDLVVINDALVDDRADPEFIRRSQFRSLLAVPLIARGSLLGVLLFANSSVAITFDEAQIDFAAKLAPSLSFALENARLYEEQRSIAETLQASLIPPVPQIPRLDIAVALKSAFEAQRVGGDSYDVFELDDGRVVAMVGDVSGKGTEAAGMTETIRSSIRTLAYIDPSPDFVLSRANASLLHQITFGHFVTVIYALIDPETSHLALACAGHPPPVLCNHECRPLRTDAGPPLGVARATYPCSHHTLRQGDTLVMYTDGLTEARHEFELFGEERLIEALCAARSADSRGIVDSILRSVTAFAEGRLDDDIAIVAIRLEGPGMDRH